MHGRRDADQHDVREPQRAGVVGHAQRAGVEGLAQALVVALQQVDGAGADPAQPDAARVDPDDGQAGCCRRQARRQADVAQADDGQARIGGDGRGPAGGQRSAGGGRGRGGRGGCGNCGEDVRCHGHLAGRVMDGCRTRRTALGGGDGRSCARAVRPAPRTLGPRRPDGGRARGFVHVRDAIRCSAARPRIGHLPTFGGSPRWPMNTGVSAPHRSACGARRRALRRAVSRAGGRAARRRRRTPGARAA